MNGPIVKIKSYKHDGKLHREWGENLILSQSDEAIITVNDRVLVKEADGSYWRTKEPAISYFSKKHWFNVVVILRSEGIYYYCNLASPISQSDSVLHYIDYDLDVEMDRGVEPRLLDEDEYKENSRVMNYPLEVMNAIEKDLKLLYQWIDQQKGPFDKGFASKWARQYQQQDLKWDESQ